MKKSHYEDMVGSSTQPFSSWETDEHEQSLIELVSNDYVENGYRFIPLVREDWKLMCDLDILFLRRDAPGRVLQAGDLDNRIKTLLDGLRKPQNATELRENEKPREGEDPFFCLLEDDKLVTGLRVETDDLLAPTDREQRDRQDVRLIITVNIRPYETSFFNLSFA